MCQPFYIILVAKKFKQNQIQYKLENFYKKAIIV